MSSDEIKVLEFLPGGRAVVSTAGFVRVAIAGDVCREFVPRWIGEEMQAGWADFPESNRPKVVEYPNNGGGA